VLSLMVVQMREAGLSWRGVKTAIEAEVERRAPRAPPREPQDGTVIKRQFD
jgi:hypothetical protein